MINYIKKNFILVGDTNFQDINTHKLYKSDEFVKLLIELGYNKSEIIISDITQLLSTNPSTPAVIPTVNREDLTTHDYNLLRYNRWSTDKSNRTFFVRTSDTEQTYTLVGSDPVTALAAIKSPDGKSLKYKINKEFRKIREEASKINVCPDLLPIKKTFNVIKQTYSPMKLDKYFKDINSDFLLDEDEKFQIDEPKTISNDPNEPAFYHFLPECLVDGEHPTWDKWIQCMDDVYRPVFKSYIYSIFDAKNHGRQCLFGTDNGNTGKSTVLSVISEFMGHTPVGTMSKDSLKNQFGYSTVYGKRLITYADCQNIKTIQSEKVHNILGGDRVPIERKGEPVFSGHIYAKLIIFSNTAPNISSHKADEVSRILLIPMHEPPEAILADYCFTNDNGEVVRDENNIPKYKGNHEFYHKLLKEFPFFLNACKKDYEKLCPTRGDIMVPKEMAEKISDVCTSVEDMRFSELMDDNFIIDKHEITPKKELFEFYRQHFIGKDATEYSYQRFVKYVTAKTNCSLERLRTQGHDFKGYKGFKIKRYVSTAVKGVL